jgi:alanine racemase
MAGHPPSRAIIDLAAYTHNLNVVRNYVGPEVKVMGVVKADAYGHGLIPMAQHAVDWGVYNLGVATVDEAVTLRAAGFTLPIVLLFEPTPDSLEPVIAHDLTLVLAERATGEALAVLADKMGKQATVHCQVDTGMSRQGFRPDLAVEDILALSRLAPLRLEGLCTHFPLADDPESDYTRKEIALFKDIAAQLKQAGVTFDLLHTCNSAGVVNFPEAHFDLVRPGLMTYGVWPSNAPQPEGCLRPVMRWETRIVQVRDLDPGAGISYGHTYVTENGMRAAILPVGYADGYRHRFSNRADVLIQGVRCPVRGNVCMDQTVVDVSHLPDVKTGEWVVLLGGDGGDCLKAEELAPHALTIPYEILTAVGNRSPREYVHSGR